MELLICVVMELIILFMLNKYWKELSTKKVGGLTLDGRKLDYSEIPGKPTRYRITVEYDLNGDRKQQAIVTADKNAEKFSRETEIPLVYVDSSDKVFWTEESDKDRMISLTIWAVCAVILVIAILVLALGMFYS